jgi:hypothetical protein
MDPAPPRSDPAGIPELEELYDDEHLALIERARVAARAADVELAHGALPLDDRGGVVIELFTDDDDPNAEADVPLDAPLVPKVRKLGASGAVLAGMMLGVGEVFEPEKAKATQIEFAPDPADEDSQLVTFHYVKGDPRASRLVIRPWLLERFRRS